MPNKSPFDTPYTGRSGNNETGLFAYDIYVTRKIQKGYMEKIKWDRPT